MWVAVGLLLPICGLPTVVGPLPVFLPSLLACDIFGFSVSVRRTDNDDESTSLLPQSLHEGRAERGEVDHPSIHASIYRIELCNMACTILQAAHASKCSRASGRRKRYRDFESLRAKLHDWAIRQAATLGQHCPQMTQRPGT